MALRDSLVTLACAAASVGIAPFAGRKTPPIPRNPHVLVIKPCCLGDMLLATPAIAALRNAYPTAKITVATSAWSRPAIEGNPHIDEIYTWEMQPTGAAATVGYCFDQAQRLKELHSDLAVVLDRSPLVGFITMLAGIPIRVGIDSAGRGFALTNRVPTTHLKHEADLYLEVAQSLNGGACSFPLAFQLSERDRAWAEAALPDGDGDWIALHPGGGVNPGSTLTGKRWPIEKFDELAGRLLQQGYNVALLGGPQDVEAAESIQDRTLVMVDGQVEGGQLRSFAGTTNFDQTGALLEQCRAFVGNDTGTMHLAVAVGTPTVAIFGPSKPPVYRPYSSTSRVVYHGEQCTGCLFRGGLVTDCRHEFACIAAATVDEVWIALNALLKETTTTKY